MERPYLIHTIFNPDSSNIKPWKKKKVELFNFFTIKYCSWTVPAEPGESIFTMILLPLLLLPVAIILEYTNFDIWWTSHFYDELTRTWVYRNHWLFDTVIHDWGRYFNIVMAGFWMSFFLKKREGSYGT
ncbi:MAG: hypothetical protein L3J69_03620 [Desulfobacula sp.]|nr:hypothetical protein [Desulfobacula sp.]